MVTPHYISDAGLAGAGGGDFEGQSRSNYEEYVDACREVAEEFGVRLVDTYGAGEPATTVDNLHPSVASKNAIAALFSSATQAKLQASGIGVTGGEGKIIVAGGYEAYIVDGTATEVPLSVGDNLRTAGNYQVVYRQSTLHSWTLATITVDEAQFAGLNSTPAGNVGYTVNSSTVDSIDLTGTTSRNHISWDAANWPVGTRVQFDVTHTIFRRFICRLSDDPDMFGSVNETVYDASFTGTVSVDHTTTVQTDYFGFLTLTAQSDVVTNLVVTFP